MIFRVRPSKTFLFNVLNRALGQIKSGIGLDVASAGFKNRFMFKTDFYYGLDIQLELLKKSVYETESKNTFAIYADMVKLDKLPDNSVDVIVSTNTLYVLSGDERKKAVQHLSRLTALSGFLMIEMSLNDEFKDMIKILKGNFKNVKIIYYRNLISQIYENIFEKDGYLGSHPLAGKKPFLALSWLISQLEYLTCKFPSLNRHAFIVCRDKKSDGERKEFDLSHLPIIDDKIYNAFE